MQFKEVIKKRKSIRILSLKKIEKKKIDEILKTIKGAPSAGNLQAFKVYLVEDQKVREKLTKVTGGQGVISQSPASLVFCSIPSESGQRYGERGEKLYSIQDATIACTFAWLAAVDNGLASVWIGAFDEEKVSKILKLNKDIRPVAILPLGYPAEKPSPKPRKNLSELVEKI